MNITKENLKPGNIAVMGVNTGFINKGARLLILQKAANLNGTNFDWLAQDLSDTQERYLDGRWYIFTQDLMDF